MNNTPVSIQKRVPTIPSNEAGPGIYSFEGVVPVVHPSAYVHPAATLIGDVWIGARCYVAAGAVLRADFGRIQMLEGSNLQDNCVVHSLPDFDCVMEEDSHIGHGAVIHGCRIGKKALVGMNAVVMDYAVVEEEAMVAAMSFVKVRGVVPKRSLVAGIPARVVRELSDADLAHKAGGTALYHELAQRSLQPNACERVSAIDMASSVDHHDRLAQRTKWNF
jgi:phenylacetic acid degradation protein